MISIDENINIDKQLKNSDAMSDHLFQTYKTFIDNVDGVNGGKKSAIDMDLIMGEVKLVETYGRQIMLKVNAGNMAVKALRNSVRDESKKLKAE